MQIITDQDEAQEILHKGIASYGESLELSYSKADHEWILVGAMQKTKGEWEYGFRAKSNLTLYSPELDIRRLPIGTELDLALETLKDEATN